MMQKCHFCGKNQKEVFKLLEGMDGVHICDSCVDLSSSLLAKERDKIDVTEQRKVVRKKRRNATEASTRNLYHFDFAKLIIPHSN